MNTSRSPVNLDDNYLLGSPSSQLSNSSPSDKDSNSITLPNSDDDDGILGFDYFAQKPDPVVENRKNIDKTKVSFVPDTQDNQLAQINKNIDKTKVFVVPDSQLPADEKGVTKESNKRTSETARIFASAGSNKKVKNASLTDNNEDLKPQKKPEAKMIAKEYLHKESLNKAQDVGRLLEKFKRPWKTTLLKKDSPPTSPSSSPNSSQHLTRTEKTYLENILLHEEQNGAGKYNLSERLTVVNDNQQLLYKIDREAVITANIDIKAIDVKKSTESTKIGSVEIRAEHNHLTDHVNNTKSLIAEIQAGTIDKNTVIAIERKQYGENLGMKDVIKIASILEYNENNPDTPIKLPAELENTPILQDALLYKIAKENKIKIISLEGKNLEHGKSSELRDENREQYMTDVINEIRGKGYNVIASVGSSHVENLEKNLHTTKHNNIGFNNIPRKLQEDTLRIRRSIPKEIINRHLTTQPKSSKSKVEALLESRKNNQHKAVNGI